jgi:prepilin-type N-terminal cleavage/methylation domain-containing protein
MNERGKGHIQLNEDGFTLAETLLAVAIIGILCAMLGGSFMAARNASVKMTKRANAQVLLTTITSRLSAEMKTATDDVPVDGIETFVSHSGTIYDGLRIGFAVKQDTATGQDAVYVHYYTIDATGEGIGKTVKELSTAPTLLLPASAETDSLYPEISYDYNTANNCYYLTVTIKDKDGAVLAQTFNEKNQDSKLIIAASSNN